ncbi:lipase family protein [Thermophilibacter sp.]
MAKERVTTGERDERGEKDVAGGRPRRRRRVLLVLLVAVVCAGVGLAALVGVRLEQRRRGEGAVGAPEAPRQLETVERADGPFTARIEFTSVATGSETVSTEVTWDDEWFFEDPTVYNHELATTCAVLSAVANSESAYYQAGSGSPAYMEDALAQLGFEDVSTASYQYRSEILDEVVDLLVGDDDVVAYSVASKTVTSDDGREKTLLLVSVRGSYGAEWLSDLNMGDAAVYDLDAMDHEGFARAASELVDELSARVTERAGLDGTDDIALLFCGHSRGAATANLAASYADDMTQGLRPLAPLGSIYCYTFATPELTTMGNVSDPLYDNIFNVLNPSDVVPRLPLAAWGYARYGHDLWLPGYGDEGFEGRYERACAQFEKNVGVACPYDPRDRESVDALVADLAREMPTDDDLASVGGMASLVRGLMTDVDIARVLCGHYPSVYIAWMQALGPDELS